MIVGNGMIAKSFSKYYIDPDVVIFASGVSNSQEVNSSEFLREKKMLEYYVKDINHLVYFSTTSIYDESLKETFYVKHKIDVENYIKLNFKSYNIFRLPNVIGDSSNSSTLIKFLYNKIKNGESIDVFSNACRYILDVEDLAFIVTEIIKFKFFKNEVVNVSLSSSAKIIEIISILEECLGLKANKMIVDKGNCYDIDNNKLKHFLSKIDYKIQNNYISTTIKKYYK